MIRTICLSIACLFFSLILPIKVSATEQRDQYVKAQVEDVLREETSRINGTSLLRQEVSLRLLNTGIIVQSEIEFPSQSNQILKKGQMVVVNPQIVDDQTVYPIVDLYRVPSILFLAALFVLVTLFVTTKKGALSFVSLIGSALILFMFTVPQLLSGSQSFFVVLISSLLISAIVVYPTHGLTALSHTAVACMVITLTAVSILSTIVVDLTKLSGAGSEEAVFLQLDPSLKLNLRSLLLGGIILATLSVLDDSVISQISVVRELKHANPKLHGRDLFLRAMEVGKDHVSTLVNTLFLAYAGSSLPLFLLFTQSSLPWWAALNDQLVAEEVVRTLVGSIGLVLSIPLTTAVATLVVSRRKMLQ